jgi:hypothetical protein
MTDVDGIQQIDKEIIFDSPIIFNRLLGSYQSGSDIAIAIASHRCVNGA